MLCEKCGKHPATTHVKRTVNGHTEEMHLCAVCAQSQGIHAMWDGFDLGNIWGSFFAEPNKLAPSDTVRCPSCGRGFRQIAETGHAGCPQCYTTFYDRLLPSLQRIHGKVRHTGKIPSAGGEKAQKARRLEELKKALAESIEKQEYETCAKLRDEIREWEAKDDA